MAFMLGHGCIMALCMQDEIRADACMQDEIRADLGCKQASSASKAGYLCMRSSLRLLLMVIKLDCYAF
jgi:hypothetical protein